jgi:hypothetical protein
MSGNVTPLDGPVWKLLIALGVPEFMKMLLLDWGIRFSATLKIFCSAMQQDEAFSSKM